MGRSKVKNRKIWFALALVIFGCFIFVLSLQKSQIPLVATIPEIGQPVNHNKENETFSPTVILTNCTRDEDCAWISVNCCSENAGAYWQCLNKNSYIDCLSKKVLCPQVISPKPTKPCRCVNGRCEA